MPSVMRVDWVGLSLPLSATLVQV